MTVFLVLRWTWRRYGWPATLVTLALATLLAAWGYRRLRAAATRRLALLRASWWWSRGELRWTPPDQDVLEALTSGVMVGFALGAAFALWLASR